VESLEAGRMEGVRMIIVMVSAIDLLLFVLFRIDKMNWGVDDKGDNEVLMVLLMLLRLLDNLC